MTPSKLTREELVAVERAVVRGWPARVTSTIDGWLARSSGGGSVRGNSVSALDFTGADLDGALARVVDFYKARGSAAKFTMTEVSEPAGLDAALAARGWQREGDHLTMTKEIGRDRLPAPPADVRCEDQTSPAWYDVYLQGLTESRRGVAAALVEAAPRPRAIFSCVRQGRVIASGLSVLDGALASVQCMAALPASRRQGAATAVLAAIEHYAASNGARRLYLQTEAANTAAINLYTRTGLTLAGRYHTRVLAAAGQS